MITNEILRAHYIKDKGILVGTYSEKELDENKDKEDLKNMQQKTGLKYSNTEFVRKNGKIVAMKLYVCTLEDCKTFK